jgi:hypothetical protein
MSKDNKNNDDGYHDIKFRIISEKVMRDLVEFLDEIQFEAAKGKTTEDIHIINLCNHLITQLINSQEGYNYHKLNRKKQEDEDILFEFPSSMSNEEIDKIISEFDKFLNGWDKAYKKDKNKKEKKQKKTDFYKPHLDDVAEWCSLEEIEEFLKDDPELTDYERFELYYDERERRKPKEKGLSYEQLLKKSGIKVSNDERKNKK